jgi:hypothetical protein
VSGDHEAAFALAQPNLGAFFEFPAGPDERAEVVRVRRFREEVENLGSPSARGVPEEARGKHPASIDHDEVALSKQFGKGRKVIVVQTAGLSIKSEQPRCVPVLKGRLRDQGRRQVEIEILGSQNSFFWGRSAAGRSSPKCL